MNLDQLANEFRAVSDKLWTLREELQRHVAADGFGQHAYAVEHCTSAGALVDRLFGTMLTARDDQEKKAKQLAKVTP